MATENVTYSGEKIFKDAQDFLPINGTDYVELYVGNAKQSAHFYKTAFGFQSVAYAGLETGVKDRVSYVLQQDKIRLVLTSPLKQDGDINAHINKHGDGVKVVALWVEDATKAWEETTSRGAESYFEPRVEEDEHGKVVRSGIHTYGETVHVFVERKEYKGAFLPGFKEWKSDYNPSEVGLRYIDHMVGNVGWGEMNKWCEFYAKVMGFTQLVSFDDKDISTEYTALMSKVMSNGSGRIKFPINEPAEGRKKSQIEEYIDFYNGAGVQHIAVATNNILETVAQLRERGVEFLRVPEVYYDDVLDRVGEIDEDLEPLKELNILIDRDDEGYLLQIFTKPVLDRPTMFFEIIQRKGAQSFGKGNFKALFEAIEREQEARQTL
ncbi:MULTISPECIES: 4-hydroxyphenylpyruvate dioxygenase [Roseivirga]|jgi:4-hydroxyphenylpyruvate dioxygenase|uniref:4-hydroxyphenylpyruvate dioxygenase n=1 Tax=Roseivirga TaxID=290180 RepID=UPI000D7A5393|nr:MULTISPECIES: 4-hydroxyphenylpyruvate dioxygenase [Roseivirga]PWL29357.1 MAG: 4-hydroxyphenylpyruvate dioxygenase [Roseivirga sp. XM-24bin3]MBO6494733.1 4-hydroxyphenylpyruvate dioxygenase [Roseivirga sp.]MCO6358343.1 4-hydroxyphenylpyruvate dioxygenase [Roseivirga pacifica]MCO6366193.1 4-hydroxyphenylpyruvate dioxygenase [Roseivirga pacifica]MCO6369256.1 4-hydroxyphenylpyruvate dioxygenase [Roseivirga pacifica]